MIFPRTIFRPRLAIIFLLAFALLPTILSAQSSPSRSGPTKLAKKSSDSLDPGTITNGVYQNKTFAMACKIPDGWVLRTDELNALDEKEKVEKEKDEKEKQEENSKADDKSAASGAGAKVLLAAFSRPPEAKGEEINASILIAAESTASYPGLTEAAQYFAPLIEVTKAQGFQLDEDPYAIAIGNKTLARGDFHKDRGTRVMRQSTLVMLSRGYAVSITVIAGTDDDVEDLIDGLSFGAGK
jgi:hypothetical protein